MMAGFKFNPEFKFYRRVFLWITIGFTLLFMGFVAYVLVTMPNLQRDIENPQIDLSSQIFSSDVDESGRPALLGNFYFHEFRENISLDSISPYVIHALIATEDRRFYEHPGIDLKGLFVAVFDGITRAHFRGASTLTMQLARNLYDQQTGYDIEQQEEFQQEKRWIDSKYLRKIKEMIVSIVLERLYTKDEILNSYLNTVSFGGNTYGIQAGAKVYFDKHCSELKIEEAALLIAMLKGTTRYNPVLNERSRERAYNRRNTVIELMQENGFISEEQAEKSKAKELLIHYSPINHNSGIATYFREYLRKYLKKWAKERGFNLYTDGLKIYTTLDSRMQHYAEEAVAEHLSSLQPLFDKHITGKEPWKQDKSILERAMRQSFRYLYAKNVAGKNEKEILAEFKTPINMEVFIWRDGKRNHIDTVMSPWDSLQYYNKFLETGFVSLDPTNGHIKAWVGGLDHNFFQYDHVKQGKRQVGSTFKPFVYTAAFDNGFSPCDEMLNQPVYFYREDGSLLWAPKNSDGKYGGKMTLRRALATSVNLITAQIIKQIGPQVVVDYAHKMGIESELDPVYSLCLGTTDLSVMELTGGYATIANKGRWNEPIFITRIEDKHGKLIDEFKGASREAISEETAYLMVDMLKGGVNEPGGTAGRLRFRYHLTQDIGGKTGTTQNHSDGWFMGITPKLVSGVWVGCADRSVHFRSITYGQGANMALPIWGIYMQKIYKDSSIHLGKETFERPNSFNVELDCRRYRLQQGQYESGEESKQSSVNFD
jgi:penicillin-binding protein 1A